MLKRVLLLRRVVAGGSRCVVVEVAEMIDARQFGVEDGRMGGWLVASRCLGTWSEVRIRQAAQRSARKGLLLPRDG